MRQRSTNRITSFQGNTATRRRNGFILVMTLILIATAAVMLVGLARQSLLLAMEAVEAQDALQQRWAAVSFQEELLKRAEELFAEQDRQFRERGIDGPPPGQIEAQIQLGGQMFQVTLGDEDAKINLNTYFRHEERQRLATMVRAICQNNTGMEVRLRPYRVKSSDDDLPAFDSWGQVFSLDLDGGVAPTTLARATVELTCWGSRRLNIVRASDKSVEQVCRLAVTGSTVQRLLELRRTTDNISLDEFLPQLQLRESELEDLQDLLDDESNCYSLWVHGSDGRRSSSSFHVAEIYQSRIDVLSFEM